MGRRLRNQIEGPTLFFVTFSSFERKSIFLNQKDFIIAEETLFEVVKNKDCQLLAYVIMPNHIHLVVGIKDGGKGLSALVFSLKGIIRKRLAGDINFWEERFDDFVLNSEKQFLTKLNYIHTNPVRKGLVEKPEDWKYSSARFWIGDEPHPVLRKEFT